MAAGSTRRRYDRAFKKGEIRMILEGRKTLAGTVGDLWILENMLKRGKEEYLEDQDNAFPGKSHLKSQDAELLRVKRRVGDLEQEREILK